MASVAHILSDLAPGDHPSAAFNWHGFEASRISSPEDLLFEQVYSNFWKEFGEKGEMEQRDVICRRLQVDPSKMVSGFSLGYEMIAVLAKGVFVAARDHTAIVSSKSPEAIVHLSHALIDPAYRGKGLVGWLRAWPIQKARSTLVAAGLSDQSPITLVAEMEPLDPASPSRILRLKSYERAGFLMVNPSQVQYFQPDFRSPQVIDADGGPCPLPLHLVIRRVGRETEREISRAEVKRIVSALYHMYGACFRKQDMASLWEQVRTSYSSDLVEPDLADDGVPVRLLSPLGAV